MFCWPAQMCPMSELRIQKMKRSTCRPELIKLAQKPDSERRKVSRSRLNWGGLLPVVAAAASSRVHYLRCFAARNIWVQNWIKCREHELLVFPLGLGVHAISSLGQGMRHRRCRPAGQLQRRRISADPSEAERASERKTLIVD